MDYKKHLDKVAEYQEHHKKLMYPSDHIDALQKYAEGLFTLSKFKVGDRVVMAETYPVNNKDSWGWVPHRHLLTKGSKATVESIDWYNNRFIYMIVFDESSYMNDKDEIKPTFDPVRLCLSEKWLELSKDPLPCTSGCGHKKCADESSGVINSLLDDIKEKSKALGELLSKLGG